MDDHHHASHPLFARFYAWMAPRMEAGGFGEHRAALLDGLAGEVIEVGAGTGLNFPRYPQAVSRVLAVEPEPHLRAAAETEAGRAPVPVEVVDGWADDLPAGDAAFDAAVTSLVLCSVPDQGRALAEVRRVLRPGGELRFLEHVRADGTALARTQRALDATVWPRLGAGCHLARDTVAAIEDAGFTIARLDRFRFPDARISLPASPHVLGIATAPHQPTIPSETPGVVGRTRTSSSEGGSDV
jgi:ubiquinone/menaquinone biosynthesis C-methylase UbiE